MRERNLATTQSLIKIKLMLFFIMGLILMNGYSSIAAPNETGGRKIIVKKGDKVKIECKVSLTDGTVFQESKPGRPLVFKVGSDEMPRGLDKAVLGMQLREQKSVAVEAKDASGKRNEELILKYIKEDLPRTFQPKIGMVVKIRDIPGTVVKIDEDYVYLDGNHPLAGKDVVFDIRIIGIE